MSKLEPSEYIYVSDSTLPEAGRGVFAAHSIVMGQLIEVCPVIEIPKTDASNDDEKGLLTRYFFNFGDELGLALGYGSLYNHSYENPNATYIKKPDTKTIEFRALRDIKRDEEITVNYNNGDPEDMTPIGRGVPEPEV